MGIEEALIQKEKSLLTLAVRSSTERLSALLSPEFLEIGASGDFFGLDTVLRSLPKEQGWSAEVQDFTHRYLGDNQVQLFYRAAIIRTHSSGASYSRRTSIWRAEGGEWKMVYHQGTPIPPFEIGINEAVPPALERVRQDM